MCNVYVFGSGPCRRLGLGVSSHVGIGRLLDVCLCLGCCGIAGVGG